MDICGLIVTGNHVKNIGRFISHFAKAANKSGSINLVARRKKRFIGYLLEQGPSFYAEMVRILTSEK
jgi:shikimate 5-dehydrogenase